MTKQQSKQIARGEPKYPDPKLYPGSTYKARENCIKNLGCPVVATNVATGQELHFRCQGEAARHFDCVKGTIRHRIKHGNTYDGWTFARG